VGSWLALLDNQHKKKKEKREDKESSSFRLKENEEI
jgi:hypothetical protein